MTDVYPERVRVVHPEGGPKLTKEGDRADSDINVIVGRYITTGVLPPGGRQPTYGDFSDASSLHECMNRVLAGQAEFAALPSKIRSEFHNDLGEFLDFVYDPDTTRADLEELGLVDAQLPPEVVAVRVVERENAESADDAGTSDT